MTDNPIAIRNADAGDIDSLLELLRELFAVEADFEFNEAHQRRGLFLMMDGCRKHKVVKVAETAGRVIGMASAQAVISTSEGGHAALVEDVIVSPAFRGRGIGRRLVESVCGWADARGITRLQLLADGKNMPALEFYEQIGWHRTQLICIRRKLLK